MKDEGGMSHDVTMAAHSTSTHVAITKCNEKQNRKK